jgi:hypothetical protein
MMLLIQITQNILRFCRQHYQQQNKRKDKNMNQYQKDSLLTRKEAANFLGVKEITLVLWKSTNRYKLPVVKVGGLAKYRYSDLLEFINRRTVNKPSNETVCETVVKQLSKNHYITMCFRCFRCFTMKQV